MTRFWVAATLLCSGCALLGKNDPLAPRYFEPSVPLVRSPIQVDGALRIGVIGAGSDIREDMVVRGSDVELSYDESQRWAEKPETYLRRALSRALFEERRIQRVVGGAATTLTVELTAFEEVVGPPRRVRVRAVMLVHDERTVLLERSLEVEQPIPDAAAETVVGAIGVALGAMVEQIAEAVVGVLTASAKAS